MGLRITWIALAVLISAPVVAWAAPIEIMEVRHEYDVAADGTSHADTLLDIRLNTASAAREGGQQTVSFSPTYERVEITAAYTLKPDGRRIGVPPGSIRDQAAPNAGPSQIYSDAVQRQVVFPDVAAGDRIVLKIHRHQFRARLPGMFTTSGALVSGIDWDKYDVIVRSPVSRPTRFDQTGFTVDSFTTGDTLVQHLHARGLKARADDLAMVGPFDRLPRYHFSNLASWEEYAALFADLALPKTVLSAPLRALADNITSGIPERRYQAQALYEWVATHIRYVAITVGTGGLEPHAADWILENRYGDCKDHVVLLHALLAAKGIDAQMALIDLANTYSLPDVPIIQNHIITYIPEFDVFADSTLEMAPFGALAFQEYGKRVVLIGPRADVVRTVPPLQPDGLRWAMRTTARMDAEGVISGNSETSASGAGEYTLRQQAVSIAAAGSAIAAKRVLKNNGDDGTGSLRFPPPRTPSAHFAISGDFTIEPRPELLDGNSFPLPVGLRLLARPGDLLAGPLNLRALPENEPTPCYSGEAVERLELVLPPGRKLRRLPKDTSITVEGLRYTARWSQTDDRVVVERRAETSFATALCSGAQRVAIARAFADIRREQQTQIAFDDVD